jgi:hypothetical protein
MTTLLLVLAALTLVGGLVPRLIAEPPQVDLTPRRNVPELDTLLNLAPIKVDDKDDEEARLLKARFNSALNSLRIHHNQYAMSHNAYDDLLFVGRRLVAAALEMPLTPAERTATVASYLRYLRGLEKSVERFARVDPDSVAELEELRYDRMTLELQMLRDRRGRQEEPLPRSSQPGKGSD